MPAIGCTDKGKEEERRCQDILQAKYVCDEVDRQKRTILTLSTKNNSAWLTFFQGKVFTCRTVGA